MNDEFFYNTNVRYYAPNQLIVCDMLKCPKSGKERYLVEAQVEEEIARDIHASFLNFYASKINDYLVAHLNGEELTALMLMFPALKVVRR